MKLCELCKSAAKVYCDSDQASLCWTCDSKVHSANFLVARHSRSLLCRVCRSPTPWTASGENLGPAAFSICEKCVVDGNSDDDDDREESEGGNDHDDDEYDGDEENETELDVHDEENGDDIQVVPLSLTPPPAASSSSDDDSVGDRRVLLKRKRENVFDLSEDDFYCQSKQKSHSAVDDSSEAINGYAIGEEQKRIRHRERISGENNSGAVTGVCNGTSTVRLNLNLNLSPSDSY